MSSEGSGGQRPSVLLRSQDEKTNAHRCTPPCIRHVLAQFRAGELPASTAAADLELSRSRFYELYRDYLAAGPNREQSWQPHSSGGHHAADWPAGASAGQTQSSRSPPESGAVAAFRLLSDPVP